MAAVTSAGRASGLEPLELGTDSAAAAGLYERHSAHVLRYCSARLRKREDAEDAVQTTFLYAVRSLRQGVRPLVESAWLLGIARNVCLARWEASRRRGRLEAVCDPHLLDRSPAAPSDRRDELAGLEDALAGLPERQRQAVLLRDWRGLSYEEVAVQLGVSTAAVETLIFRGRNRLAELLREEPSTTRRRLTWLGNLGALANGIKGALTGAAAATKVAAAVTAIAVSGAGLATLDRDAPAPPAVPPTPSEAVRAPLRAPAVPVPTRPRRVAAPQARAVAPTPAARAPRAGARPAVTARDESAPALDSRSAPATPAEGGAQPPGTAPPAPAEKPERTSTVPAVAATPTPKLPPPVTSAVDEVVDVLLPGQALPAPAELPVVGPVVGPVAEPVVETAVEVVAALPVAPLVPPTLVPDLLPGGPIPPLSP